MSLNNPASVPKVREAMRALQVRGVYPSLQRIATAIGATDLGVVHAARTLIVRENPRAIRVTSPTPPDEATQEAKAAAARDAERQIKDGCRARAAEHRKETETGHKVGRRLAGR